jgi:hypothetical protein
MHRELPGISARFSIGSLKGLRQVHAEFSPEELVTNELILQNRESIVTKARAGRVLQIGKKAKRKINGYKVTEDMGSIACVSGYLVNMVDRTVALISPCRASDRRPRGYRVYAQGTFRTAEDFASFIEDSTEACMPDKITGSRNVAFRDDLEYAQTATGFTLCSNHRTYKVEGEPYVSTLGELIARGDVSAGDILGTVIDSGGDIFAAGATLQDLFDKGLLEEEPLIVSDKSLFRNSRWDTLTTVGGKTLPYGRGETSSRVGVYPRPVFISESTFGNRCKCCMGSSPHAALSAR